MKYIYKKKKICGANKKLDLQCGSNPLIGDSNILTCGKDDKNQLKEINLKCIDIGEKEKESSKNLLCGIESLKN